MKEAYDRACESCKREEQNVERLRQVLYEAEDRVKALEHGAPIPGKKRRLEEALQNEHQARQAYSEANSRLEEEKRGQRQLRMRLRREQNGIEPSWDFMPEFPQVQIDFGVKEETNGKTASKLEEAVRPLKQADASEGVTPPEAAKDPKDAGVAAPAHSVEVEGKEPQATGFQEISQRLKEAAGQLREIADEEGVTQLWNKAKKQWRVFNQVDVSDDKSLRYEIFRLIDDVEEELKCAQLLLSEISPVNALKAHSRLAQAKQKLMRLRGYVNTAQKECPQISFPALEDLMADGFTLIEDVTDKKGSGNSSAQEIARYLQTLSLLRERVRSMPEREGVVDCLQ